MTIKNYPGGKPVVILGTDGTNLYGITTDTSGHLQVDVLSSALPTGAATQTTLADILTRLNAIKITRDNLVLYYRVGTLASSATWTTLIDRNTKMTVRSLLLSSDYASSEMRVVLDGTAYVTVEEDGSAYAWPSPASIYALGGSGGLWSLDRYDSANDVYVVSLVGELHCDTSFALQIRQQSGVSKNIGIDVVMQNEV